MQESEDAFYAAGSDDVEEKQLQSLRTLIDESDRLERTLLHFF